MPGPAGQNALPLLEPGQRKCLKSFMSQVMQGSYLDFHQEYRPHGSWSPGLRWC